MHSLLLSSIVFGEKWVAYVVEFETKVLKKVCMTKNSIYLLYDFENTRKRSTNVL